MSIRETSAQTSPQAAGEVAPRAPASAAAEDPFRMVADYTYDWESWHGADGKVLWLNPAVERLTGSTVGECLELDDYPLPLVLAEDRPSVAEAFAAARRQQSGQDVEFRVRHRDGELRWLSLCWQPMYGAGGEHLGFRTSIRDITERQLLREQLKTHAEHLEQLVDQRTSRLRQLEARSRQMEKLAALGQLAAGVAHEINNPLAGIRNSFELFKLGLPPTHKHFELLDLVDREIERISGIVHQMYQLYRHSPQQASEFALDRVVSEVAYLLDKVAEKRRVTLQFEQPAAPVEVTLAESAVKQVLYNLLRNAIQASPLGETVTVSVAADGEGFARVQVTDRGPGIPPSDLPRIFDPFFSTKLDGDEPGMGLGLSVSRSLIETMGGRIDVECPVAGGCRFTAVFPCRLESNQE